MKILLKGANLWCHEHFEKGDILISEDTIEAVGDSIQLSPSYKEVDCSGQYILPGVFDCHAHSTMSCGPHHMADFFAADENRLTIEAVLNCEKMARCGITTIRDCGGKYMETLAVRDAIAAGKIIGPRMLCSGTPLKVIGGHEPGYDFTGPYQAREATRDFIHKGVDFIKVMVTGGLGKAGEDPDSVEMEYDELAAIVTEAKKKGRKVAGHCHSKKGMEILVAAGADSIEHSTYLDKEIDEKIIKYGVYIVPTFDAYVKFATLGEKYHVHPDTVAAAKGIVEVKRERLFEAYKMGANIAFGRDSGGFMMDQGDFVEEMLRMEEAGMSRVDIIQSATEVSARLCGVEKITGSIENGKAADLIILSKNPLYDLKAYRENLCGVYCRGRYLGLEEKDE